MRKHAAPDARISSASTIRFEPISLESLDQVQSEDANKSEYAPDLSIIVPTRNESGNITQLLDRLDPVISNMSVEIVFVDDSTDSTPGVIEDEKTRHAKSIRLIHRLPEQRVGGLGGAVVEGMRAARGQWLIVMDGDLQHPPELIPQLINKALADSCDVVIASRYCAEGSASSFNALRSIVSRGSTLAAKALFPRHLHHVDDPMTGFFLVRRSALDLNALRPNGFKILLDILARTPNLRVGAVPFEFGERYAGESKASLREGMRFLKLLLALRLGPGFARFAHFGLVGVTGLLVNSLLLAMFTETVGLFYMVSLILATQGSTLWNFCLTEFWVFHRAGDREGRVSRGAMFFAMNNAALLARGPMVFSLTAYLGLNYLISNVLSMAALLIVRYAIADSMVWKVSPRPVLAASPAMPIVSQEQEVAS